MKKKSSSEANNLAKFGAKTAEITKLKNNPVIDIKPIESEKSD